MRDYAFAFIKTLTESEVNPGVSNQHELNGVKKLENIFGTIPYGQQGLLSFNATIKIEFDGVAEPISFTWYNARANTPNRHEYRLYYTTNSIVNELKAGDTLFIGKTQTGMIEAIVFKKTNTITYDWTPFRA